MLKYLLEKEFKQIMRNKFLPRMIFVFPFMVLLILPLAANYEIKNINLSIVDNDKSPYSQELIRKLDASDYFRVTDISSSYAEGLKSIELDEADIIVDIPPHFEKDLINEKSAKLMICANTVNGIKGGLGSSYLAGVIADFNKDIRSEWINSASRTTAPSFSIVPQYRYNPYLRYPVFMVPALMVMLLTMICGFLPALNIVGEKEKGTIEQINVTPVHKFTFILSKLIPYWVIGFIVLTICFFVAWLFYRLLPVGNFITIYVFVAVFILGISGMGLVISNYANTIQQAMFIMFFFIISLIFLSGLYSPVESMPGWAQIMSHFSPLKYLMNVMRLVYLKGSNIAEMIPSFLALSGFALFFNGWAVLSYRKSR